ncbi:hypothetical protein WA158_008102 [Blastocystis sp. Blastoise]
MDQVLLTDLAKMKKATAWRGDGDIRSRIDEIVNEIKGIQKKMAKKGKEDEEFPYNKAEKYWDCFSLGLQNKSPKVREASLQALQDLISDGYITGEESVEDQSDPEKTLIDEISEACCQCVEIEDDNVFLQLSKTLNAIITSHGTSIHGDILINAIHAFFDSYVYCKNNNKEDIKNNLIDVLKYLFKKLKVKSKKSKKTDDGEDKEDSTEGQSKEVSKEEIEVPSHDSNTTTSSTSNKLECESIYPAVEEQMGFQYKGEVVVSKDTPVVTGESKNDHEEEEGVDPDTKRIESLPSTYYKDAYILFRRICNIASDEDEPNQPVAAIKMLALEVLSPLIANAGPDFSDNKAFIYALRKYLIPGLLQNFVSSNTQLVEVSLQLFVAIIHRFHVSIKKEVEIFICNVFLVILNSPNSSEKQKELILTAFIELVKDPQFMVEIFVNYDCDMNSTNVYERICMTLNNVIQGKFVQLDKTPKVELEDEPKEEGEGEEEEEEDESIEYTNSRMKAVMAMLHVIQPLAARVKEFIEEEKKKSNKAEEEDDDEEIKSPVPSNDIAARFDEKRRLQEEMATGFAKFNKKPRKGVEYLVSVGRIENTPESVAKFLFDYSEDLSKTVIGDYLGEDKEFNLAVLAAYASIVDYTDMTFDLALRSFLSHFRLPGEAQKIDRILERFAGHFYECNPSTFDNADTAFVLGFSVIMLNTDLHNPNIPDEKKMTKQEFINNNRGINDGKDLPKETLEGIFDEIEANPITLKEDDLAREKLAMDTNKYENEEKKRQRAFDLEKNEMLANIKLDIDPNIEYSYIKVDKIDDYIRSMYKLFHSNTVHSLGLVLQYIEEEEICKLSLEGAHNMFIIAAYYNLDDEKAECIQAIASSGYVYDENWLEISPIQVESLKILIDMAINEYNYIGKGWKYIMKAISSISQIHLYGLKSYVNYLLEVHQPVIRTYLYNHAYLDVDRAKEIEESVESVADLRTLDKIFLNSDKISNGIIDFVDALCEVSLTDIKEGMKKETEEEKERKSIQRDYELADDLDERAIHRPRVYLMQKVVEVADFNMNKRGRYDWQKIWTIISDYLIAIGCMNNVELAFSGIDGLKQLSLKFLDKEESKNFHFQKVFLRPFDSIISRCTSIDIKDLILHVIHNIILSRYNKLSSGWKAILSTLISCAEREDETTTIFAWSIAKSLIDTYFERTKTDLPDIMNCYVAFAQCENEEISSEAFKYLSVCFFIIILFILLFKCGNFLLEGNIIELVEEEVNGQMVKVYTDSEIHIRYWWPILLGFTRIIPNDYRYEARKNALERLFLLLNDSRTHFSIKMWSLIFQGLILPIFSTTIEAQCLTLNELFSTDNDNEEEEEHVETESEKKARSLSVIEGDIPTQTTGAMFITDLARLFINKYDQLNPIFNIIIDFLHKCILQGLIILSRIAIQSYSILLIEGGNIFNENTWNLIIQSIDVLYTTTSAKGLLEKRKELSILPLEGKVTGDILDVGTYVKTPLGVGQIIENKENYFIVMLANGKAYFQDYNMEVIIPELLKARKEQEELAKKIQEGDDDDEDDEEEAEKLDGEEEEEENKQQEESKEDDEFKLTDTRVLDLDVNLTIVHATVQLELSVLLKSMIQKHYKYISMDHINNILTTLTTTKDLCEEFNNDEDYRTLIHNLGFMKESPKLPLLARQEGVCLSVIICVLFSLYTDKDHTDRVDYATKELLTRVEPLLTSYVSNERKAIVNPNDIDSKRGAYALIPVVNEIFDGFSTCTIESFKQNFLKLYPLCVDIIEVGTEDCRKHVAKFFREKIGTLLFDN